MAPLRLAFYYLPSAPLGGKGKPRFPARLRERSRPGPNELVIHTGPAAYSCLTTLHDGQIDCLYECGERRPYETLTFARFGLSDLRNPSLDR
jgi:hypothetical protein